MAGAIALAGVVLGAAGVVHAQEPTQHADFVYADANEGSASGGHLALRLGDRTYHFGYHEPGFLRLDRDDSSRFEHVYGTLENRNLQILRVAVSGDTFERLRRSFNERHLTEEAEFEALAGLERDRAFLEEWRQGLPTVEIRAAGYFVLEPEGSEVPPDDVLTRVRRRVAERWGEDFLARRREASVEVLTGLARDLAEPVPPLAEGGRHPAGGYGPSRRAERAQSLLVAIDVLERGRRLAAAGTIVLEPDVFPIDEPTREVLRGLLLQFEAGVVDLLGSRRPDAGYALLVGLARLLALEESLRANRLVLLDVFPPDPVRLSVDDIEARGGSLPRLRAGLREEIGRVRRALVEKRALREADYATLEGIAARYAEIDRAQATGSDVRVAEGTVVPERPLRRPVDLAERPSEARLRARVAVLSERRDDLRERLLARHRYQLLEHNCASELFAQVERAIAGEADSVSLASAARLGGWLPAGKGLRFIPVVAADAVATTYRVDENVLVPSYRRRRVAEMTEREGLVAALRESNVLTSTVYESNPEDSAFLFFTDGSILARPVLGAVNLLYGLGASLAGLPVAPWDQGALLGAGLRGALWSLPEVAFINVRKGSFFFEPAPAPHADGASRSQSPST